MSRSRSHPGRWLLGTLVVLVVLALAADRVALLVAEDTAGTSIQRSQGLQHTPDVDVAGFPFLTQLASGNYDKVTVTATDVPVSRTASRLSISKLVVVLHGVHASSNFGTVHVTTADATATISYAELSTLLGLDVSYAGGGRVRVGKSVEIAGQQISASITSSPTLADGALTFTGTAVSGAGQLADAVTRTLSRVFDVDVPLQGIPFDVRAQSLSGTSAGLALVLTGSNLTYTRMS